MEKQSRASVIEEYLRRKAEIFPVPEERPECVRCRKPQVTCYCADLKPIAVKPRVVILMHPLEARHPVGTGRMAHRSLIHSDLWIGTDFTHSERVNALINDPKLYPVVLYPGPQSRDISRLSRSERLELFPSDREPVIIVLDATWHCAKRMLHRSPNLQALPRICFTPTRESGFIVRKQPHAQCFSTIEAIHEIFSLIDPENVNPSESSQPIAKVPVYASLLEIFNKMVAKQLGFRGRGVSRHHQNYLARKARREKFRQVQAQARARKASAVSPPDLAQDPAG